MKANVIILAMASFFAMPSYLHAAGRITVVKLYIACHGDDIIGRRLCFALKEKFGSREALSL